MHFHAQFKSPSHIVFCHHFTQTQIDNWNFMSQANKSNSGTISVINDCINNSHHTHTVIARSIFDNNVWHNFGAFHHKSGDLFDMCQNRLNFLLFVRIAKMHTFSFSINSIHLKMIFVTPTQKKWLLILSISVTSNIISKHTHFLINNTLSCSNWNEFLWVGRSPPTPYPPYS